MANVFSLCNEIEQFLQENDQQSINQFLDWIQYRFSSPNTRKSECDKSMINTSQMFICQCGHRYSLRVAIDDLIESSKIQDSILCKRCLQFYDHNQIKSHDCEQGKIDELQSLEQLIPPDTIEQQPEYVNDHETSSSARVTHFGLPKLTDSIVEVIHSDGKRQFRCPLCFNSYVNRSGLNRHYITHSSQDLWKVECQFCGKRYSRKDSLKHHMKTQHAQFSMPNWTWKDTNHSLYPRSTFPSYNNLSSNLLDVQSISSSPNEKEQMENDDIVSVT